MRKIVVVTWYFPVRSEPYRGHSAYQTLRKLQEKVPVEVLCPQLRYPLGLRPRSFPNSEVETALNASEVPVRFFDYPVIPIVSRPLNGFICSKYLAPILRESQPDLVLNFKVYPEGYAAVRASRELGVPSVVMALGSDLNRISDPLTGRAVRYALAAADRVLTVSDHLRRRAIQLGADPEKVTAVLNGCDTNVFFPADRTLARRALHIDDATRLILFVGRVDILKGVRELLEAFIVLAHVTPGCRLVLVGEGPAASWVRSRAQQASLQDRVQLVPPQPSTVVAQWLAACDVFTLPSYAEGCPNVVVEALNCGRPVVASHVGGIPELVTPKNGMLVQPRSAPALAQALAAALEKNWDFVDIAASSRRSWADVADEVHRVCAEAYRAHAVCEPALA